jgi:hypothetical protein
MSKIFLWADRVDSERLDLLCDRVVVELQKRPYQIILVPYLTSLLTAIEWINARARPGDVALALESGEFSTEETNIFYLANNSDRKKQAELISLFLIRRFPQLVEGSCRADTTTELGSLAFCRQINVPSLVVRIGSLSQFEVENAIEIFATALAESSLAWSQQVLSFVSEALPSRHRHKVPTSIDIKLNQRVYEEAGLLVNGNACIPVDLCDRLGIDFTRLPNVRLFDYNGVVYLKAIDLRDYNISVRWESLSQTVILRSILAINRDSIDRLMGRGNISEVQAIVFFKAHRDSVLDRFPNLVKIYREEGLSEGVNYDIAFAQMCWETDFLNIERYPQLLQNNFANLGKGDRNLQLASFPDLRLGIRAHIQHLKAYASTEPLRQEVVDPRFHLVQRGIVSSVFQLSSRWSADLNYGNKIMAVLRRLYESANLL